MTRTNLFSKPGFSKPATLALAIAFAAACGSAASSEKPASAGEHAGHQHPPAAGAAPAKTGATATANLAGPEGSKVAGKVTFKEISQGVAIVAHLSGVTGAGAHGFHLHEVGECTPPDFTTAGSHFNPAGAPHGARDAAQHHAGDLGNIQVNADGTGTLEFTSHALTVAPGPNSVVGRAVILHEKADDMVTQPTGNAGGRIACGVIKADG